MRGLMRGVLLESGDVEFCTMFSAQGVLKGEVI